VLTIAPRSPGMLIAGIVSKVSNQTCEFRVNMGGQLYTVACTPGGRPDVTDRPRSGESVRVLGLIGAAPDKLRAITIDVYRQQPGRPGAEWINWYNDLGKDRTLWVYTIAESYMTGDLSQYNIKNGERVLVYARWMNDRAQTAETKRVGKLSGNQYTLVSP